METLSELIKKIYSQRDEYQKAVKIAFITDKEYSDDVLSEVITKGTFNISYFIRECGCGDKKIKFDEKFIRNRVELCTDEKYEFLISENVKQPKNLVYGKWKNLEIGDYKTKTIFPDGRYCFSSKKVYFYLIKESEKVKKETESKIESLSVDIGKDLKEKENCNCPGCNQEIYFGQKCVRHYHNRCLYYHDELQGFCGKTCYYKRLCEKHYNLHIIKYGQGKCCWKDCDKDIPEHIVNHVYCDDHDRYIEQVKLRKAINKITASIFNFTSPDILNLVDKTFKDNKLRECFVGFEEEQYQKFLDVFSQYDVIYGRSCDIKGTMEGKKFSLPIFSKLIDRGNPKEIKELERLATL